MSGVRQVGKERDWKKEIQKIIKNKKFFLKSLEAEEIERAIQIFQDFCIFDLKRIPSVAEEMLMWKAIDSYIKSCRKYPSVVVKKGEAFPIYNKEITDRNREIISFLRELKVTPLSKELPEQRVEVGTAKKIVDMVFGKYDKKKK